VEEISVLQAIINGGPSLILAVALVVVWRTWRADRKETNELIGTIRQCLEEVQDQRVQDAQAWSEKYNELAAQVKQSLASLERFTGAVERFITRAGNGTGTGTG
jgi:hypothetical protein